MWAVGGVFFALIALAFVGLGQVMGRAFDAIPDRVVAYTVDVCGSLTGIAAFAAMSYLQLPPTVWFVAHRAADAALRGLAQAGAARRRRHRVHGSSPSARTA